MKVLLTQPRDRNVDPDEGHAKPAWLLGGETPRLAWLSASAFFIVVGSGALLKINSQTVSRAEIAPLPNFLLTGAVGVVLGLGIAFVPWNRWPPGSMKMLPILGFVYLGLSAWFTGYAREPQAGAALVSCSFFALMWTAFFLPPGNVVRLTPLLAGYVATETLTPGSTVEWSLVLPLILPMVVFAELVARSSEEIRRARDRESVRAAATEAVAAEAFKLRGARAEAEFLEQLQRSVGQVFSARHVSVTVADNPQDNHVASNVRTEGHPSSGSTETGMPLQLRIGDPSRIEVSVTVVLAVPTDDWFMAYLARLVTLEFTAVLDELTDRRALEDAAFLDPLTRLGNRRVADAAIANLTEGDVLLVVDLDKFKAVNDSAGHASGDALLQRFARCLLSSIRPGDVAARLGGDEFIVAIRNPSTDPLELAERLRYKWIALEPATTISIGVSVHRGIGDGLATLGKADAALYAAKQAGRDTIRLHR